MTKLSREERDILRSFERSEWRPIPDMAAEIKKFQKVAAATRKNRRITIELPAKDIEKLRAHAERAGVSYQRLVTDLIQEYLSKPSRGRQTKPR